MPEPKERLMRSNPQDRMKQILKMTRIHLQINWNLSRKVRCICLHWGSLDTISPMAKSKRLIAVDVQKNARELKQPIAVVIIKMSLTSKNGISCFQRNSAMAIMDNKAIFRQIWARAINAAAVTSKTRTRTTSFWLNNSWCFSPIVQDAEKKRPKLLMTTINKQTWPEEEEQE